MNRLQRLYIREFGVLLLIVSSMLSAIFSIIYIIEKIDELMPYKQTTETLILLGTLKIPEYLRYLLPMASLLCSIFVISLASRRNEIIAIKASGVNLRRFFIPFIITGVLLVTIDFVIAEFITPASLKKSNDIVYSLKGGKNISYQEGNIWIRAKNGLLVRAKLFVPQEMELYGISVFYMHDGRLTKRIEAEKGVWSGQDWRLQEVREFDLNRNTVRYIPEKLLKGVGETEIIEREKNRLSEMSVMELIRKKIGRRRLHEHKAEGGYSVTTLLPACKPLHGHDRHIPLTKEQKRQRDGKCRSGDTHKSCLLGYIHFITVARVCRGASAHGFRLDSAGNLPCSGRGFVFQDTGLKKKMLRGKNKRLLRVASCGLRIKKTVAGCGLRKDVTDWKREGDDEEL
ncbi:MAG: YjgP/YjgQ family permease [Nitrospirae bacterium]|nr:YjgP/YjgQ family permease [Nitrospirota bacterium]